MHELSLITGMLGISCNELKKYNKAATPGTPKATRITGITLEVGQLSCLEEQTLVGCFELCAENTPAEGAILTIIRPDLLCHCQHCGTTHTLQKKRFSCPACASTEIRFEGGFGCVIAAINVEGEDHDE